MATISQAWTIPKDLFDQLKLSDPPITRIDTAAKVGVSISRDLDGNLIVEPFAFIIDAWKIQGISLYSSSTNQPSQTPDYTGKWCLICSCILAALILWSMLRILKKS